MKLVGTEVKQVTAEGAVYMLLTDSPNDYELQGIAGIDEFWCLLEQINAEGINDEEAQDEESN
jgi:hypothetical protein